MLRSASSDIGPGYDLPEHTSLSVGGKFTGNNSTKVSSRSRKCSAQAPRARVLIRPPSSPVFVVVLPGNNLSIYQSALLKKVSCREILMCKNTEILETNKIFTWNTHVLFINRYNLKKKNTIIVRHFIFSSHCKRKHKIPKKNINITIYFISFSPIEKAGNLFLE